MKHIICTASLIALLLSAATAPTRANQLPNGNGTDKFPAAGAISLEIGGTTNCSVLLTGTASIRHSNYHKDKTNVTLQAEIISLDLLGFSPVLGTVRVVAGSNAVGIASTGMIIGETKTNFPADSFFDTFLAVRTSTGLNLVNQTPLILDTGILRVPPISDIYTNANQVPLVDAANPNQTVAQLIQMWFSPAAKGKDTQFGVSLNVFGTNTLGTVSMLLCPSNAEVAATAQLKDSNYTGIVVPNPGCDALGETNLFFACAWNSQLHAPEWQGGHEGNWIMYTLTPNSHTNVFAAGTMQGSNGAGTHRAPLSVNAEDCSSCLHFEGGLVGNIIGGGGLNGSRIQASYAGEHLDNDGNPIRCCPPPATPPIGHFRMTIDGIVITKCLKP